MIRRLQVRDPICGLLFVAVFLSHDLQGHRYLEGIEKERTLEPRPPRSGICWIISIETIPRISDSSRPPKRRRVESQKPHLVPARATTHRPEVTACDPAALGQLLSAENARGQESRVVTLAGLIDPGRTGLGLPRWDWARRTVSCGSCRRSSLRPNRAGALNFRLSRSHWFSPPTNRRRGHADRSRGRLKTRGPLLLSSDEPSRASSLSLSPAAHARTRADLSGSPGRRVIARHYWHHVTAYYRRIGAFLLRKEKSTAAARWR